MLVSLHVKNLALLEEAEVEFGNGLNILSGETGAGKSIIIGSINLELGEKAPKEMLRDQAEYALVELIFRVDDEEQARQLQELDIYPEDGEVIMSRKITATRSVGKINSETVSAAFAGIGTAALKRENDIRTAKSRAENLFIANSFIIVL